MFFSLVFQCYQHLERDSPGTSLRHSDGSCQILSRCEMKAFFDDFLKTVAILSRVGLGSLFRIYLREVVVIEIDHLVNSSTKAMYETAVLDDLITWIHSMWAFFDIVDPERRMCRQQFITEVKEAYARSRAKGNTANFALPFPV